MNDKIKEYKEKINWDVWKDVTPLKKDGKWILKLSLKKQVIMSKQNDMEKLAKDIWKVIFRYFKNKSDKSDVSIIAAVLLKTSIELYTIALKENSDIERLITEEAVPSIPKLRDSMERMVKPTMH